MALIKTTEEIQECFKVDGSTRIETIAPYIKTAQEKYMPKYLGDTLLSALDAWYEASQSPTNAYYLKLLPYVQMAIANFAYHLAADDLNIHSGENGFTVLTNTNHIAASGERSTKFKENRLALGYESIELMLIFLEKNKQHFSSWTSSPAYTISYKYPINTADQFNSCIDICQSRLMFTKLWPFMDKAVTQHITGAISKALYDKVLAELKAETLAGAYLELLTPLRQCLAFFAWAYKAESENDTGTRAMYYTWGQNALNTLLSILDNTPSDYPEYANSAQYVAGRTSYAQHTNNTNSGYFTGGTF